MQKTLLQREENPDSKYTYYAFISYKREDEKWAKWLQKKLETYKLPSVIRKEQSHLPKKIFPIFRDKTDLTAGTVKGALFKELEASKYLIVICSPLAAQSEYVEYEVESFIKLGREKRIIPFIIEGEVQAQDPAQECFVPALINMTENLPEVSVLGHSKRDAFLKVAAGLLDIKFDELKRRDRQRQTKNKVIISVISCFLLPIVLILGYVGWIIVPREAYYTDYVLKWGIPEGIYPLTEEQTKKMRSHYKIVITMGKVSQLVHANSAGKPVAHTDTEKLDRPMNARFYYLDYQFDNQLSTVEYVGENQQTLLIQIFSPNLQAIDFVQLQDPSKAFVLPANSTDMGGGMFALNSPDSAKSDIVRHELQYNEQGVVTKILFRRDNQGTPAQDINGISGIKYDLDKLGRVEKISYIDENSQVMSNKIGVAGKRHFYDDRGNLIRTEYLNETGTPVNNEQGWMICETVFNSDGNPVQEVFLDTNGELILRKDGFAKVTFKYNERGNIIEVAYFGVNGESVLCKDDFTKWTVKYNERGNIIEVAYFGVDGKSVLCKDGFAKWTIKYDEQGNRIEDAYFGVDDELVLYKDGFAKWTVKYDEHGNRIEDACFGVDGESALHKDGFAKWTYKYDEQGSRIEDACFGVDGEQILSKDGYAKMTFKYEQGNRIEDACFGVDGEPILHKDGYAIWTAKYNESGNRIEGTYLGVNGEPILHKDGYTKWTAKYNEHGDFIEVLYFGLDGEPVQKQ